MPGAFHRARPAAGRHEAVGPSSTRLRHTGRHAVADVGAHIAGRFTRNRSFSARFNEVACGLGATTPRVADSLPSDGGNCIIRDLTRQRHAASQLLMPQNPHTRRHGRRRVADKTGRNVGWREITHPARATCHPFRYKTHPARAARRHFRYKTRPARATCHPFRYKTLPTRAGRRHYRYKTRPARTTRRHLRYKTRPARPKWPNLARFALAGRIFSRFCRQQAEQGEFSHAPVEAPSRARKKQHSNTTLQAAR